MAYKLTEKLEWGQLATFIPNKDIPRYRWFYYKEGYARDLVFRLIEKFGVEKGQAVLDPFNGSGTTILACKERGINATGVDVSDLAVFASNVKAEDYDFEEIKGAIKQFIKAKFRKPDVKVSLPLVKKAFSKYALEDIRTGNP